MNQTEIAITVNVRRVAPDFSRIEVRESSIHGRGLFATDTIHPPYIILRITPDRSDANFPYLSSINHSCQPTAKMVGNCVVPILPLQAGDEITVDFTVEVDTAYPFDCKCGAPNCKGRIYVLYNAARAAARYQKRKCFLLGADGEEPNLDRT